MPPLRPLGVTLLLCVLAPGLQAQPAPPAGAEPPRQVHWAVSAFFGTGWYRVDENR